VFAGAIAVCSAVSTWAKDLEEKEVSAGAVRATRLEELQVVHFDHPWLV